MTQSITVRPDSFEMSLFMDAAEESGVPDLSDQETAYIGNLLIHPPTMAVDETEISFRHDVMVAEQQADGLAATSPESERVRIERNLRIGFALQATRQLLREYRSSFADLAVCDYRLNNTVDWRTFVPSAAKPSAAEAKPAKPPVLPWKNLEAQLASAHLSYEGKLAATDRTIGIEQRIYDACAELAQNPGATWKEAVRLRSLLILSQLDAFLHGPTSQTGNYWEYELQVQNNAFFKAVDAMTHLYLRKCAEANDACLPTRELIEHGNPNSTRPQYLFSVTKGSENGTVISKKFEYNQDGILGKVVYLAQKANSRAAQA